VDARLSIQPVRRAVWSLDPGLALTQVQPLDEILRERYYAQPRFSLIVLVTFAAIGLLLGLAASRLIASQLWGTSPFDPLALGLAVAVILAIGLLACYVPAARAVRIDLVAALRLD
jgi:hypothetical protein